MSTIIRASNPRRRKKKTSPKKLKAKSPLKKRKRPQPRAPRPRKKKLIVHRKKVTRKSKPVVKRRKKIVRRKIVKKKRKPVAAPRKRRVKKPAPKKVVKKKRKPVTKRKPVEKKAPSKYIAPKYEIFKGTVYFNVEGRDYEWLVLFVYRLRELGVKWFRFLRRVPEGAKQSDLITETGYFSTRWMNLARMPVGQIRGLIGGMLVPGVDELLQVIVLQSQLPRGLISE